jgi:peptidoglycan/LPS O-acetylase OafA/YrhL
MLDGIRAFAVLAVMAYHAGVVVPRGGFFGVDTFFTLSGFLITSLLIREWDRTDGIVLPSFWMRRARRLLPALCLMLAALAVYSQLAHQSGRWPTLGSDEVASLFYFANWHFLATGADYFNQSSATSPVNHTWSLAIEEQFYLIWPLIVLVCLRLRTSRVVLLVVAAGGTIASAIEMAVLYRPENISRVYYGTDTRAQSLLIGATLAILLSFRPAAAQSPGLVPRARFVPGPGRRVALEALGLAGMAGSALIWFDLSSSSTLTYMGGFGLAGLATCAVIASVILQPKSLVSRLLSVRPLVFIGCISYGMYLWHYPLFLILDGQHTGLKTYPLFLLRSAVTVLVATASYYWLE